jgi:hypothetical protein
MYRSLKIVLAGKQMMLPSPNRPNALAARLRGPMAPHLPRVDHARRTTAPARSWRRVTAAEATRHYRAGVHPPDVHAAIARVGYDYAQGIDDRDWMLFRSVFDEECHVDFRSWSGAPAATMASAVWVQAVRSVTGAFDATQHLMTNLRLQDGSSDGLSDDTTDSIVGVNEVQAQHWFSADTMASFDRTAEPAMCTLGGVFTNRYVLTHGRWRIASCRFTLRWTTGDETLFTLARQRS